MANLTTTDDQAEKIRDPKVFANHGKTKWVHDWQAYIGENTRKLWSTFTDEQRVALMLDADEQASKEEWD